MSIPVIFDDPHVFFEEATFDKDLDLTSRQQHILIEIIGAHSRHEFNAGFQAAKDIR